MGSIKEAVVSGLRRGARKVAQESTDEPVNPMTLQEQLQKKQDNLSKSDGFDSKLDDGDVMEMPEIKNFLDEKDLGDLAGMPTTSRPSQTSTA